MTDGAKGARLCDAKRVQNFSESFQGLGIHKNSFGMLIEIHHECLRIPTNSLGIPIEISLECFRILVNSFVALVNASMSEAIF